MAGRETSASGSGASGTSEQHVVMFSSGAGSWAAAQRVAEQHGTKNLTLLFSDVSMEDEDNYRFLIDAAADIYGVTMPKWWHHPWNSRRRTVNGRALALLPGLVVVKDGRDIWQVFKDDAFLGNTRLANCSKFLKQRPARAWLDANRDPATTTVYVGIDWSEQHRLAAVVRNYLPYRAEAPLCEAPYLDKDAILGDLRARGVKPPRLYDLGFAHANCGGGCVRAGQGQFAHLLKVMPDRYLWWEENEQDLRDHLDKDVSILRDRTRVGRMAALGLTEADMEFVTVGKRYWSEDDEEWRESEQVEVVKATGKPLPNVVPLTLRTFRERHEAQPEQTDLFDIGGCGCFVDEGDVRTPKTATGDAA